MFVILVLYIILCNKMLLVFKFDHLIMFFDIKFKLNLVFS